MMYRSLVYFLYLVSRCHSMGITVDCSDANPEFCLSVPTSELSALCSDSFTASLCMKSCNVCTEVNCTDESPDFCLSIPAGESSALCSDSFTANLCMKSCNICTSGSNTDSTLKPIGKTLALLSMNDAEPGCRTDGGAKPNKRCIFPFIFDGKNFTTCATHGVKNWCAVKVDSDGTYISGEWGNCEPTCPTGTQTCPDTNEAFCIHNERCMNMSEPCAGNCLKEGYWNCDGTCIESNQICNDMCSDPNKWLCDSTCISKEETCNDACYYNRYNKSNHEYDNLGRWHYKNPRAYCPETEKCKTVTHDICNFSNMTTRDVCAVSKDLCSSDTLENRGCSDDNYQTCDGHWPGQCILRVAVADGVYDCLDRSDETKTEKLWLVTNETTKNEQYQKHYSGYQDFKFAQFGLESCGNGSNERGLTCNDLINNNTKCVPFKYWCKRIFWNDTDANRYDDFCPSYDDVLCGNTTFWNSVDRNNSSCQFQCSSSYPGQCIPFKNVCNNDTRWNIYGNLEKENCRDKSDEICEDHEKCDEFGYDYCDDQSQCIHPDLWCDGYYNCNDHSDENESRCGTEFCDQNPIASFSCPHKYTNITICASLCNNYEECRDGMDENDCGIKKVYTVGIVMIFVVLATTISAAWNKCLTKLFYKSRLFLDKEEDNNQRQLSLDLIRIFRLVNLTRKKKERLNRLLKKLHQTNEYSNELIFLINFCKISFTREKGTQCLKYIYDFELSYHDENVVECEQCLKTNIGTNVICQYIMDAKYPGLLDKLPNPFLEWLHNITKHYRWHQLMRFTKVSSYYLDIGKDVALVATLLSAVNIGATSFTSFSYQIILIYVLSILIPILINWVYVALFHLEEICGCFGHKLKGWKRIMAQFFTFIASPFLPGIIIYQRTTNIELIEEHVVEFNKNIEKIDEVRIFKSYEISRKIQKLQTQNFKLKGVLTAMQKCEMIEIVIQTILSTCLLFMNLWRVSLTQDELQGFFNQDVIYFLAMSLPLLLKKLITTILNVRATEKDEFTPIIGMLSYSAYGFLNICVRIISITLYFSVPVGLFNILTHWVYENMNQRHGLIWREYDQDGNPVKFSSFNHNKGEFEVVEMRNLAPTLLTNSNYTKYTGLSLFWYYILFLTGMLGHLSVVMKLEVLFLKSFNEKMENAAENNEDESLKTRLKKLPALKRKEPKAANRFLVFFDSLMALVLTTPFTDWDEINEEENMVKEHDIVKVYKRKWRRTFKEFVVSLLINFLENLLLVSPLLFLYVRASERHLILEQTIGPNLLEEKAMNLIWELVVGSLAMVTLSIPLQIAIFTVYNYYGHPWKRFLNTSSSVDQGSLKDLVLESIATDDKKVCSNTDHSLKNKKLDKKVKENSSVEPIKHEHKEEVPKIDTEIEERHEEKMTTHANPLDEAYEMLEKQIESLRLLQR